MAITPLANIKGPKGDVGDIGPQGLPGAMAASNDAQTAGFIATSGTSETLTALKAREVFINVKDFGAVGDGVADDSAAFDAAISEANSLGGSDRENVTGITIICPDGRYKLTRELARIGASAVSIRGSSRAGTVLLVSAPGTLFTYGDPTRATLPLGLVISDLRVEYLADPSATAVFLTVSYGFDVIVQDIQLVRVRTLVSCGTSADNFAGGVTVRNIRGSSANVAGPLIDLKYGAGLMIEACATFVRGVLPPVHPAPMTTVANANVVNMIAPHWDTVVMSDCVFERYANGFAIVATPGTIAQNIFVTNTIFDYIKDCAFYLLAEAGGTISTVRVTNSWAAVWEGNAVEIDGDGINDFHNVQLIAAMAGMSALRYYNPSARNNKFTIDPVSTNRLGTAAGALYFAAGSTGFTLSGSRGNYDNGPGTWRNDYGVTVGANCDHYVIVGNSLDGTVAGINLAANASGSTKRRVAGNVGAGGGTEPLTLPASNTPWVNTAATVSDVHIHGGTVTAIKKGSTTVAGMVSGHVRLEPGESLTVTYSVAPSVTRFVQM